MKHINISCDNCGQVEQKNVQQGYQSWQPWVELGSLDFCSPDCFVNWLKGAVTT